MNRLAICALVLLTVAACSRGGSNDAGLPVVPQPDASITCTSYHSPGSGAISIAPLWQERVDECRALSLCEVDGACLYGCPREMVTGC
jgi:hypothetical protein